MSSNDFPKTTTSSPSTIHTQWCLQHWYQNNSTRASHLLYHYLHQTTNLNSHNNTYSKQPPRFSNTSTAQQTSNYSNTTDLVIHQHHKHHQEDAPEHPQGAHHCCSAFHRQQKQLFHQPNNSANVQMVTQTSYHRQRVNKIHWTNMVHQHSNHRSPPRHTVQLLKHRRNQAPFWSHNQPAADIHQQQHNQLAADIYPQQRSLLCQAR